MSEPGTNYTQGYSQATQATHASRTIESDASFLIPHIKPTDSILDVGCGPGTITIGFVDLLSAQGSVVGVDISETVLQKARANYQAFNAQSDLRDSDKANAVFLKADLLSPGGLPFEADTFDVVFSSQLFPHLSTPEMKTRALTEMRRVLKPGGILATRDAAHLHFYPLPPAIPSRHDLNALWAGNTLRPLRTSHLPGGDMPRLFYQVGFGVDKVKIGAGTTAYTDAEARQWFAKACKGRLEKGETFRESWQKMGITDEEIEDTKQALDHWAAIDGAWYVAVQAQMLG
ncbi:methyltransferase [Naviculisporaceae sp. PSN 640]